MKSQVLHTVWCNISGEAVEEIKTDHLGVKGLKSSDMLSTNMRILMHHDSSFEETTWCRYEQCTKSPTFLVASAKSGSRIFHSGRNTQQDRHGDQVR